MTDYIAWGVGGIVGLVGLAIMYKALKEPIDLVIYWVGRAIGGMFSKVSSGAESTVEVINYS